MQAINVSGGLCMTCNNAPGCYYRARRGPALFCEMFDNYMPPVERINSAQASPLVDSAVAPRAPEKQVSKYAGLCMNCDHRQACAYPKPEGGIWHCEDYE